MNYTFDLVELRGKIVQSRKLFILIITLYIILQFFEPIRNLTLFKDYYYYIFALLLLSYTIFILTVKPFKKKGQIIFKDDEIIVNKISIPLSTIKNIDINYRGYKGEIKSHSIAYMIMGYEGVNNFVNIELEDKKFKVNFFSDSEFDIKKIEQIEDQYKNCIAVKPDYYNELFKQPQTRKRIKITARTLVLILLAFDYIVVNNYFDSSTKDVVHNVLFAATIILLSTEIIFHDKKEDF